MSIVDRERTLYKDYAIHEFFEDSFDIYPKGSDTLMYTAETLEEAHSIIDWMMEKDKRAELS